MKDHYKESHIVLWYGLVFFSVLAISAFSLLVQLQASEKSAAEFFEPIQIPLDRGLF